MYNEKRVKNRNLGLFLFLICSSLFLAAPAFAQDDYRVYSYFNPPGTGLTGCAAIFGTCSGAAPFRESGSS